MDLTADMEQEMTINFPPGAVIDRFSLNGQRQQVTMAENLRCVSDAFLSKGEAILAATFPKS